MTVDHLRHSFHWAMHAMGAIHGFRYTNSREAFDLWYGRGARIFEVDLAETADKKFVCFAHHLRTRDLLRVEILEKPLAYSAAWFLDQKLFRLTTPGLTPLSLVDLTDLLREKPDLLFMLDLFGQFAPSSVPDLAAELSALIGEETSLWDRFLIETYSRRMTRQLQDAAPKARIIYGIDDSKNEYLEPCVTPQEILDMGVEFVSIPWAYRKKHPGVLESMAEAGLCVFSRVISDLNERSMRKSGVQVLLVDFYYNSSENSQTRPQ